MEVKQEKYFALLTGANSGLGLSLCSRFTTEFLLSRPSYHSLTLIFTTRSQTKSLETAKYITQHLASLEASFHQQKTKGKETSLIRERITLAPEIVDLADIKSVIGLSDGLKRKYPKIDWVFLNAGMTTIKDGGINWPRAIYKICTDFVNATTYPDYKLEEIGAVSSQKWLQSSVSLRANGEKEEDELGPLGTAFTSNLFGHYIIVHEIMPLLLAGGVASNQRSRVIWTSSLEAFAHSFDIADIQCLKGKHSYESSKRLTDLLILSYNSNKSSPLYADYFTTEQRGRLAGSSEDMVVASPIELPNRRPLLLLTHPGICGTSFVPLHPILSYVMALAFLLARIIFNSHWHTASPHIGNTATCYTSFASEEELEGVSAEKFKWGSAASRFGKEQIKKTEVVGWMENGESIKERIRCEKMDFGGKVKKEYGSETVVGETREEFLEVGRMAWVEMERLRKGWVTRVRSM